jgi:DNA-binding transcriptional regulator YdaS (Cro superfamily)
LRVQQVLCPPFQPWHKPHIERFFRSFSHDLLEFLPGFAGHNVADAQKLRDQQAFSERLFKKGGPVELGMDAAALQDWCDRWLTRYEAAIHSGLGDQSPWQRWHTYRGEPLRVVTDPRALDLLLAAAPGGDGLRKVLKQGIKFDQAYFVAAELADRVGDQVLVRYDPSDMGRCFVFEPSGNSGKFLCVAVCAERLGLNPQAIAQEAMARQRAKVSAGRKHLKALARKVKPHEVADQILYEAATQQQKLSAFPLPTQSYDIPALAEAATAVEALTVQPPQGPSVVERAELAREQRRLQAEEAQAAKAQPVLSLNAIVPRLIEQWRAGHEGDLTERETLARVIDLAEGRGVARCYLSEVEFRRFRTWVLAPKAIAN